MRARLRLLSAMAVRVGLVGLAVGLVFAVQEVAVQRYLAGHLWRTALHALSYDTLLGALAGAAAACGMWLSLSLLAARARSVVAPAFAVRLTTCFAAAGAVALLVVPRDVPRVLGVSHWVLFGLGAGLIWLGAAIAAADSSAPSEDNAPQPRSTIVWSVLVALVYLVGLGHLWLRGWPGWITVAVACAGSLAALGLASILFRPVSRIASWLGSVLPSPPPAFARWGVIAVAGAAAVLWIASPLVAMTMRAQAKRTRSNVLIIAVDTLRYDAVSLLGKGDHDDDLTPQLRSLLTPHATVFTHAYSASAWTLASFSSMFTGLYPEQHRAEYIWSTLGPEQTTLAELLREHGYDTMAVVSGHFTTRESGVAQGFSECDERAALDWRVTTAEAVTDRALGFLKGRGKAPFFLFVHYFEPHFPYIDHPGITRGLRTAATRKVMAGAEWRPLGRVDYDGEVAFADRNIGRLLKFLDRNELWKNTCVIFVADHGEEFYEHGAALHGRTLFQEIIHVPLAIAAPGADRPRVVSEPVETRRLFSTILQVAGVPSPLGAGTSLLTRSASDAAPIYSATCAYGRNDRYGPEAHSWLSSLTSDRYKLIHDRNQGTMELFDLRADPGEQRDLSRTRRDVAAPLARALTGIEASLSGKEPSGSAPNFGEQEQRELKDLGYL